MNSATPLPSIFDTQSLAGLKNGLRKDDPQALKAAAQQFEAIFLQMMMKSMRAASPQDSVFDSDQSRFYQELLDSQLSQVMSAKGGTGLAAVIERQLAGAGLGTATEYPDGLPLIPLPRDFPLGTGQRGLPLPKDGVPRPLPLENSPVRPIMPIAPTISGAAPGAATPENQAQAFASHMWPQAVMASQTTGIPPQFLIAHAALESGWGKSEPRFADGRQSHNLFGIKAGSNWPGETVESVTTEYVNGVAERRVERFRAYGSYAESFEDYARLLAQSPRYAAVVGSQDASSFARGLQRAGYATDPAYANKLMRVIGNLEQKLTG
ncbi:MAG: flagellar assembly peptidoglycan hydrolase FlgJ [Rhodocyclaceae bacterium]|nr:flagellar assembly peptidoglycan hydrolase FlgJ [Rhodocyclaceae bacterium]MDZ4215240.1 flagellar assembly peptidoglycan hydrolase FlgJ [Rhodocyclaceae bacterium]